MKKIIWLGAIFSLLTIGIFAQCPENIQQNIGQTIANKGFNVNKGTKETDFVLALEASVKNTSWEIKGAESAVLTLFVDGKYNQDVILFNGAKKFVYRTLLGKFKVGKHQLVVVQNQKRSAPNAGKISLTSLKIQPADIFIPTDKIAIANAPFLYLRPDTIDKFSDIPLTTYYEVLPNDENSQKIRYTIIFTNEDGGTQTAALMARWGRTTDIEWVYETEIKDGKLSSEIIQGANHVTKNFVGQRVFGSHPLISDVTTNNNFADTGCSGLRIGQFPIKSDLSKKSRETIMDENPWTYRIMAQEAIREGRINPDKLGENSIADLRDYVFAEVHNEPKNTSVSVEVKTADGNVFSSDNGKSFLWVDRKGYLRIALRLPRKFQKDSLNFSIICHPKGSPKEEPMCSNLTLLSAVRLDENFYPQVTEIAPKLFELKGNEKANFEVKLK